MVAETRPQWSRRKWEMKREFLETPRFGGEGAEERDGNGGEAALSRYLSQGQEGPACKAMAFPGRRVAPGHWTLTAGVQDTATHLPRAVSLRCQEVLGTEHRVMRFRSPHNPLHPGRP